MDADYFDQVATTQIKRSTDVLLSKAGEYANDGDRLHNFKVAAATRGVTPIQALSGMMVKHTVSVYDMMESGYNFDLTVWDEKITDHINYLILLRALVEEQQS